MIEPTCIEVRLFPFQIHQKLSHTILDWLNKTKSVRSCVFPLANLQKGPSIDNLLPQSQKILKILHITLHKPTLNLYAEYNRAGKAADHG